MIVGRDAKVDTLVQCSERKLKGKGLSFSYNQTKDGNFPEYHSSIKEILIFFRQMDRNFKRDGNECHYLNSASSTEKTKDLHPNIN